MNKKNTIIAIIILIITIPLFSDVGKFKMYEQSSDTIEKEVDSLEVDYDSNDYEIGYKNGIKYYTKLSNNQSCFSNYHHKLTRKSIELPNYILKKNLNYRTGFEHGYRDKNILNPLVFISLIVLAYCSPLIITMIVMLVTL